MENIHIIGDVAWTIGCVCSCLILVITLVILMGFQEQLWQLQRQLSEIEKKENERGIVETQDIEKRERKETAGADNERETERSPQEGGLHARENGGIVGDRVKAL